MQLPSYTEGCHFPVPGLLFKPIANSISAQRNNFEEQTASKVLTRALKQEHHTEYETSEASSHKRAYHLILWEMIFG